MAEEKSISNKKTVKQYWTFQLLAWSIASLYWAYNVYFNEAYSIGHTFINFILDVSIGVSITHAYKLIIKKSDIVEFTIGRFFKLILPIIVLSVIFMVLVNVKWFLYWTLVKGENLDLISSLSFWDPPLITGLRLMTIWVLAYHLYHYYQKQIALSAHNAELSIVAKQVQLDHLSNQLNPHFLFNSLNSVKSLISENPSKAKRSIDLLSDLLRSSIYTKDSLTSIEDELQLVYDYVELEKLRFEERLHLKVNIDEDLLKFKIPSLSIQTLVENALKHGIQNSIKGGIVTLIVQKERENIIISVQNPGQLNKENIGKTASIGLQNLKKRLHLQYKEKGIFSLIEEPQGIVTGTIIIPGI